MDALNFENAVDPLLEMDYQATVEYLATLSLADFDRLRKKTAKRFDVRPATLDADVRSAQKPSASKGSMESEAVELWPDDVNPVELFDDLVRCVQRFIICEPETAQAAALWAGMTWFMDVVQVAPLAVISAPEKRCGKSQLLFVLGRLVQNPQMASSISPAALFRVIDAWKPTLLLDEADAFMKDNEELRGLINCGHTRDSAYVIRVVGDSHEPTKFNAWSAKAISGIGYLAETLMDRSIVLELRRKMGNEHVDRIRHAEPDYFKTLSSKLARFADDYRETIRKSRPQLPDALNDRAQDNWEPLLAIADSVGGHWPETARKAALKISGDDSASVSIGVELLSDIQEIFEAKKISRISTADLVIALCEDDEKPWATYSRGNPIKAGAVSKKLSGYGIRSKTIRLGLITKKGFERSDFEESFSRYLSKNFSPDTPVSTVTPSQPRQNGGCSVAVDESVTAQSVTNVTTMQKQVEPDTSVKNVTGSENVTDESNCDGTKNAKVTLQPSIHAGCYGVTVETGGVAKKNNEEILDKKPNDFGEVF